MAAESFVIQDWRPAFNKWFIAPSQRELIPSFLGKGKKNYSGIQDVTYLPTHRHLSVHQPGRNNCPLANRQCVWQTSRLIHPRTKAGKYFVCGSWRSSCLPQPCTVLLLLHSWQVHIWMHGHASCPGRNELDSPQPQRGFSQGFQVLCQNRGARTSLEEKPCEHLKTCVPLV